MCNRKPVKEKTKKEFIRLKESMMAGTDSPNRGLSWSICPYPVWENVKVFLMFGAEQAWLKIVLYP